MLKTKKIKKPVIEARASIQISEKTHKLLKIFCKNNRRFTIGGLTENLIEKFLKDQKRSGGKN